MAIADCPFLATLLTMYCVYKIISRANWWLLKEFHCSMSCSFYWMLILVFHNYISRINFHNKCVWVRTDFSKAAKLRCAYLVAYTCWNLRSAPRCFRTLSWTNTMVILSLEFTVFMNFNFGLPQTNRMVILYLEFHISCICGWNGIK